MVRKKKRNLRANFALIIVLLVAVALFGKLFEIQVVKASAYNEASKDKRAVPVTIPSLRGDIVDREGTVLATTQELYDVQVSPKNTRVNGGIFYRPSDTTRSGTEEVTTAEAIEEIAAVTGQDPAEIADIIGSALEENPDSDFAYVKRAVDLEELNALKGLYIPWLTFDYNYQRMYPNGAVGGNIIGFSGSDATPLAGVELSQDQCLQGSDGYETYERGADGVALPGSHIVREKAVAGGKVELTLDLDLQWQAQQIVNESVKKYEAEWVLAVVMDVKTGELVAVAEDGSVDPGNIDNSDPLKREARSFVLPYEPGSTYKTITMASLIEEGLANPATPYDTPWTASPENGVKFSDSFVHTTQPWTMAGIMVNSSNVGTAMLGTRLSAQKRYDYLRAFGIGESTNAGMPLEDSGILHSPDEWDRQTNYNTTFGQGLSTTIVQSASAYQAIANGGLRVPPSVVRGCYGPDGSFQRMEHGESVQVVSTKTAETTLGLLETVVQEGWWGDDIFMKGYRFAGKTGTSEQPDGKGGYRDAYVHSFAAIFPVDNPRYVIVASLGFPSVYEAGTLNAIKIVGELSEVTIRTMKVAPSSGTPTKYPVFY